MAKGSTKKKRGGVVLGALGGVLILGGVAVLTALWLAPQEVERVYGNVRTEAIGTVDRVREQVFDDIPTVRLGVEGDRAELDWCDGSFITMRSYEREGVPTTAAAHNNCGGDVLLSWDEGQKVGIEGTDDVYEVVDIRYTSKIWSSTDDLVGLQGDLALQSCFYGEDRMKFVGMKKIEG
ncbi:hypothetical protein [Microbacterium sp. gxy059]|uniref:hypothetical protein n=1 Tax=Microbacterium sp. gxy059 TaxID=2957199 RepID=UPI003D95A32E